jgi:hypothetical protein
VDLLAGTALPSMISILSAASEVCITDHPSSPALTAGTIQVNIQVILDLARGRTFHPLISTEAHEWGSVTDPFALEKSNYFTKIIAADCLWMPSQHRNLAHSITHFLSKENSTACALVVAGFHTGRGIVADFFRQFSSSNGNNEVSGQLNIAEIYESDMQGNRRGWLESRANEGREEAKRWCVVAVITKK